MRRERSLTDRRSVVAVATERGRELAEKAPPLLRDRFRHELAKLSDEQQMQLLATLDHVATMMQAPKVSDGPFLFNEQAASRKDDPSAAPSA